MGTTEDGTILGNVAPALNTYNDRNGNCFKYSLYAGPQLYGSPQAGMDATTWTINMTNNAITTIMGGYGVIYDVHQVKGSSNYLSRYDSNGVAASTMWHYVAGEGYDSSDPSNRICYYYDSNNQKYFTTRHLNIPFRVMAVLINDYGLILMTSPTSSEGFYKITINEQFAACTKFRLIFYSKTNNKRMVQFRCLENTT